MSQRRAPGAKPMHDLHKQLREALVAYKDYLETGERLQQFEYREHNDDQFGFCYSMVGKTECIAIKGGDAVEQLRTLRKLLRSAMGTARSDKTLGPAIDVLTSEIPFMTLGPDPTVNQSSIIVDVDSVTGAKRPFNEYVRANVSIILDKALKRLPKPEDELESGGRRGGLKNGCLKDPIPVVSVIRAVGHKAGRSDKLAEKMSRHNYPIEVRARKYYCQRADAIAMFPRKKQRIEEIQ